MNGTERAKLPSCRHDGATTAGEKQKSTKRRGPRSVADEFRTVGDLEEAPNVHRHRKTDAIVGIRVCTHHAGV